jgi:hypothetical protein
LDSINFAGNYQLANFIIEDDGEGHTLIVDPPVTNGQTPGTPPVASNQNSTGSAATDGFVFNFAASNPPPAPDSHPADSPQFHRSAFANGQAAWAAAHDGGQGDTAIGGGEAHDSFTSQGILKAHLHAAEFHFV